MKRRRRINADQLVKEYVVRRVVPAPSRLQLFELRFTHTSSIDVCGSISETTDKGANRRIRVGLDFVIVQTCECTEDVRPNRPPTLNGHDVRTHRTRHISILTFAAQKFK